MKKIRIGSGAGYGGDRLEPALTLLEQGKLDFIGFECLAERTIALAQKEKQQDPSKGYNPLLTYRMEKVLPLAYQHNVKVLTNMGAAHPESAMNILSDMAKTMGLKGMKIAAILGDDIFPSLDRYHDLPILETGKPLSSLSGNMISANAYLGAWPLVEALQAGADIILTGRVADPSLFLAPLIYSFGWSAEEHDKLGKGTLVGHLLECAGQISGGYFADPGKKEVPDLWNLGFPYIEVEESGQGVVSKVEGSGGIISTATCTEQLLYEIHDPARYITPDCVADFSKVHFTTLGKDKVGFQGASGSPATDTYKVSVGYRHGFLGVGEISYGGTNCLERAKLASDIIQKRLALQPWPIEDLRMDLIGVNAISPLQLPEQTPVQEVRLRVAGRTAQKIEAQQIANEVEALYTNGPAGGGGATRSVEEVIAIASILVPKSEVPTKVIYKEIQ